jgi:hypothetical protein
VPPVLQGTPREVSPQLLGRGTLREMCQGFGRGGHHVHATLSPTYQIELFAKAHGAAANRNMLNAVPSSQYPQRTLSLLLQIEQVMYRRRVYEWTFPCPPFGVSQRAHT